MSGTNEAVLVERRGSALWIIINRPDRRNAINAAVMDGLAAGFRQAIDDGTIRAVVLTGAGDRAFCAGGDLEYGTSLFSTGGGVEPRGELGELARLTRRVGVPIVGRINGVCVAGGMAFLALCDLAVAADQARFALPEARIGVFPMQVIAMMKRILLPRHLTELLLTCEQIDAARAREIGLVNHVVPAGELDAAVERLLGQLHLSSPAALRRGRYVLSAMEDMSFEQAIAFAEGQIVLSSLGDEAAEGISAFKEKRRPGWAGES